MTQRIVAFVGISGVGKTTYLKTAAKSLRFQHLGAGSLIANARQAHSYDNLRLSNISENQSRLVAGFHAARDADAPLVILDGHVIVQGPCGIESIDSSVFHALGIDAIAHLVGDPLTIVANRTGDATRKRPELSADKLRVHQAMSVSAAQRIGQELAVPVKQFYLGEYGPFLAFLSGLILPLSRQATS